MLFNDRSVNVFVGNERNVIMTIYGKFKYGLTSALRFAERTVGQRVSACVRACGVSLTAETGACASTIVGAVPKYR